jgi:hypothetical protein
MTPPEPTAWHRRLGRALAVALLVAVAGASALAVPPALVQQSEALAQRQHEQALQAASQASGPRLWFAGFAMNATSQAFAGDVQLAGRRFASLGGPVIAYQFSNALQAGALQHPLATPQTLARTVNDIAAQARAGDIVVLLLSTHGAKGLLSVNLDQEDEAPMTPQQLAAALAPLRDTPTVLLLSACHAGSFIPGLRADHRIVLAAAAADRSSFGCHFESRNTWFIDALFGERFRPSLSLAALMTQAKKDIAVKEAGFGLRPSRPQMWVGARLRGLAQRPLDAWHAP